MLRNSAAVAVIFVMSLLLGLVGCAGSAPTPTEAIVATPTPMGTLTAAPGATIRLTADGPVPSSVTIKAGTPILFVLEDDSYSKSTIKFDSGQVGTMQWLLPGQSRVFTQLEDKEPGEYTYAMITRPDKKGTIIIQ